MENFLFRLLLHLLLIDERVIILPKQDTLRVIDSSSSTQSSCHPHQACRENLHFFVVKYFSSIATSGNNDAQY